MLFLLVKRYGYEVGDLRGEGVKVRSRADASGRPQDGLSGAKMGRNNRPTISSRLPIKEALERVLFLLVKRYGYEVGDIRGEGSRFGRSAVFNANSLQIFLFRVPDCTRQNEYSDAFC